MIWINDARRHRRHVVTMSIAPSLLVAAAAVLGLVAPPMPAQGASIVMPLCNGNTIEVGSDEQRAPPDDTRGCHVACTMTSKSRDVASLPDD